MEQSTKKQPTQSPKPTLTKAEASKQIALRYLRLAALALHDAARECYLEEAVEAMKHSLLMEELGR